MRVLSFVLSLLIAALATSRTSALLPAAFGVDEISHSSASDTASADGKIALEKRNGAFLSDAWLQDFAVPPRVFRPLQIVHGRDLSDPKSVEYFRDDCELGGLVVNVGGNGYVREQANWDRFVAGVKNLEAAGMRVWIYDEEGYPSLGAGGFVLEGRPELAALELAFDPEHNPPYYVRDCYEFTHACNNYASARRYPNPLNPAAIERFLDVTHRRYRAELTPELYDCVEAFFTDEPSLPAVDLGQIPEESRRRVPTIDPIDPTKKQTPVVPWCDDMEARYREKYGEELAPNFKSLFGGDSEADRAVRGRFWALVGELNVERFYAPIQNFCREDENGPIASGHTLYEENIILQVPLDGNKIAALKTFDLPGLDMLTSNPRSYFWGAWRAAAFPCSAAEFLGKRRVMTEISDHSEINSGERKPVELTSMEAAAAWQAAFGVTEFTLYYGIKGGENAPYRNEASHRDYCRFVGRLNAVLRDAVPVRPVLLYYPIDELQAEYLPVAKRPDPATQSERARRLFDSFNVLGEGLARSQISFVVADRSTLQNLTKNPNDSDESVRLTGKFSAVVFPSGSEKIDFDWAEPGLREIWVDEFENPLENWQAVGSVVEKLGSFAGTRLAPETPNPDLVEGSFEREGRLVFVVSNSLDENWNGKLRLIGNGSNFESNVWTRIDPKSGSVETFELTDGVVSTEIAGRGTIIFASPIQK